MVIVTTVAKKIILLTKTNLIYIHIKTEDDKRVDATVSFNVDKYSYLTNSYLPKALYF
jgi:hypothetical protein